MGKNHYFAKPPKAFWMYSPSHNSNKRILSRYEPQGDAPLEDLEAVLSQDGFSMPFKSHLKKVELDAEELILPLLGQVRRYVDMEEAPAGKEECGDCEILENLGKYLK